MKPIKSLMATTLLSVLLTACGGGGGDSSTTGTGTTGTGTTGTGTTGTGTTGTGTTGTGTTGTGTTGTGTTGTGTTGTGTTGTGTTGTGTTGTGTTGTGTTGTGTKGTGTKGTGTKGTGTIPIKEIQFKLNRTLLGPYGPSRNALLPPLANVIGQNNPDAKRLKENVRKVLNVVDNAAETIIEIYTVHLYNHPGTDLVALTFKDKVKNIKGLYSVNDINSMSTELMLITKSLSEIHPKLGKVSTTINYEGLGSRYTWSVIADKYYIDGKDIGKVNIKLDRTSNDLFEIKVRSVDGSGQFDNKYEYTFSNNKEKMVASYNNNDYENSFYTKHDYNSQVVEVGRLTKSSTTDIVYKASYDVSNNTLIRN